MADDRYERGSRIRREVLGDAHVDASLANQTPFDAPFQRFITELAWGTAWAGDVLDKRTRHLVTIAILAALGREHELALHLRATANTGVTPAQIREMLHHVAAYAGIPAANTAFAIAKRILVEREEG
jgi:4-carboxymuconolactone decarboxylase